MDIAIDYVNRRRFIMCADLKCCCKEPKIICELCLEPICIKTKNGCFISGHYIRLDLPFCVSCWENKKGKIEDIARKTRND